jgi:drug/metabolite transporter (DMT)-like permease
MASVARSSWVIYFSLILVASFYGGWAVIAKEAASRNLPLFVFAFYRCFGGALLLILALLLGLDSGQSSDQIAHSAVTRVDCFRFAFLGLLMAANVCGFIFGASQLPALTCSIFQPTVPVVAMIVSALCGVEVITRYKLVSVLLCVVGAIVVVYFSENPHSAETKEESTSKALGVAAILLNVSSAASYFVAQKKMLEFYSPLLITAATYAMASFFTLLAACASSGADWNAWSLRGDYVAWTYAGYGMCLATAFNYSVLAWINKHTSPTTVTTSATLQPIATVCLSWGILAIPITAVQAIGGCCIGLGLLSYVAAVERGANESAKLLK